MPESIQFLCGFAIPIILAFLVLKVSWSMEDRRWAQQDAVDRKMWLDRVTSAAHVSAQRGYNIAKRHREVALKRLADNG